MVQGALEWIETGNRTPAARARRVDLYYLYHLLNHFNLFGSGYLGQVSTCLSRLTAN